jgi:hypothetical protein
MQKAIVVVYMPVYGILRGIVLGTLFLGAMGGVVGGFVFGIIYPAQNGQYWVNVTWAFGVCMVLGMLLGIIPGFFIGAVTGVSAAIMTGVFYSSLKNPMAYKRFLRASGALISGASTYLILLHSFKVAPYIPLLSLPVATLVSTQISRHLASWYTTKSRAKKMRRGRALHGVC